MGKVQGFAKKRISQNVAEKEILLALEQEKIAGEALLIADKHKEKAFTYMQTEGLLHLDVVQNNSTVRLQSTTKNTIKYDMDALKKKLDKAILREVINKKYFISDVDRLKKEMKKYGMPPNILRDCIEVTESVDNKTMDDLYEAGHLKIKQIKGCYTLTESVSLKIKEM